VAGMNNSDMIIAINEDPKAQIFDVAHYAIVGDIYEIIPELIARIKDMKKN
jgi:electron transfer flavoprotein alpha subunit